MVVSAVLLLLLLRVRRRYYDYRRGVVIGIGIAYSPLLPLLGGIYRFIVSGPVIIVNRGLSLSLL